MLFLSGITFNLLVFFFLPDLSNSNSLLASIALQPVLLSLLAGFALRNALNTRSTWIRQSDLLSSRSLSIALSLMGAQFVLSDLLAISWKTILSLLICIVCTCLIGISANRFLKIDNSFMIWLLAGNCICGPAAISFASQIFNGEKKDIAKAIWINTLIGFILMVLLPLFAGLLQLGPDAFGVWAGSSLQSTAQVVTSASIFSSESTDIALLIKSFRILMLLPLIFFLKLVAAPKSLVPFTHQGTRKSPFSLTSFFRTFPRFLIIFLVLAIMSVVVDLSGLVYGAEFPVYGLLVAARPMLGLFSKFCLSLAMFAVGYLCCFELSRRDYRAIFFAIFSALQLVFVSYFMVKV